MILLSRNLEVAYVILRESWAVASYGKFAFKELINKIFFIITRHFIRSISFQDIFRYIM